MKFAIQSQLCEFQKIIEMTQTIKLYAKFGKTMKFYM